MSVTVFVPELADDTSGGIIAEWYEEDGATVSAGQLIFRLERDFIAFDVEAEEGGILRHRAKVGEFFFAGAIVAAILPSEAVEAVDMTEADVYEPLPEPMPLPAVNIVEDFETPDDGAPWTDAAPEDGEFEFVPEVAVDESTDGPVAEDEAAAFPETVVEPAWDAESPAVAWDEELPVEAVPEPAALRVDEEFRDEDPVAVDFLEAPGQGCPMWDDAVAASTESEMHGTWGSFEEAMDAADREDYAFAATDLIDDDDQFSGGFQPARPQPYEDSSDASSWNDDDVAFDEDESASLFDAPPAGGSFSWSTDESAQEPVPDSVFEMAAYGSSEEDAEPLPHAALESEAAGQPSDTYFETEAPAGPSPDFDAGIAFGTGAEEAPEADVSFASFAEVDAEAEYQTPGPEASEFMEAPVASSLDDEPATEADIEEAFDVELPASAPVLHMSIELDVGAEFADAPRAFSAAVATAVELVVSESWADVQPAIAFVDSDTSPQPGPEDVIVFDFAAYGIEIADAPLNGDAPVAFAIGKTRERVAFHGQAIRVSYRASISMSYDSTRVSEFEAARLLAGVRTAVEAKSDAVAA